MNKQYLSLLQSYYKDFYWNQLGLQDWKSRIKLRIKEEEAYCTRFIDWIEEWLDYDFAGKKVLVVGSGTGGEVINFYDKGADVFGVEPNSQALMISKMKASLHEISGQVFIQGYSENLPFDAEQFDFVYCYTVLEHVQDVKRSIEEMVRVTKLRGRVFIETPDYRQCYEPHYKLPLPMFLPKWVIRGFLFILNRPTSFLDSLRFVNSRMLTNIFMNLPVTAFRIIHSWPEQWIRYPSIRMRIIRFITRKFEIQRDQIWILQKLERPR